MKKQVNYKLPEELIEALQQRATVERTTATDLIIQGMSEFLGLANPEEQPLKATPSIYSIVGRLEEIEERLSKIEDNGRFNFMYQSLSEASDIEIRIEGEATKPTERIVELEKQVANLTKIVEEVLAQKNQNQVLQELEKDESDRTITSRYHAAKS
jgi:hypothetical protein